MTIPFLTREITVHTALPPDEVFKRLEPLKRTLRKDLRLKESILSDAYKRNWVTITGNQFWFCPARNEGYKPFIRGTVTASSVNNGSVINLTIYEVFRGCLLIAFCLVLFDSLLMALLFLFIGAVVVFMSKDESTSERLCDILSVRP